MSPARPPRPQRVPSPASSNSHSPQDFFTEGLWGKLPPAWQAALEVADPPQLAAMLLGTGGTVGQGTVWPLSLLAFTAATRALSFPRGQLGVTPHPPCQSPHLHPLLRRHVKPKKQHEIRCLGKVGAPVLPLVSPHSFPVNPRSPLPTGTAAAEPGHRL